MGKVADGVPAMPVMNGTQVLSSAVVSANNAVSALSGMAGMELKTGMQMPVSETFASHLFMTSPDVFKIVRIPPWLQNILDNKPYIRQDQGSLNANQQERFLCAYNILNSSGQLGQLVAIHAQMHFQHGTQRFLPWHRVFLLQLENALRSIHPDVSIPYWDWTKAAEQGIPAWLQNVTPTVQTPNGPISVTRAPGPGSELAGWVSGIPSVQTDTDFPSFTGGLEGIHNMVHVWVGGSMGIIATAPADPIFWMHHANIDRLWWQWQQSANGNGKNPNLNNSSPALSPIMDPWPFQESDTRDIHAMGYDYA